MQSQLKTNLIDFYLPRTVGSPIVLLKKIKQLSKARNRLRLTYVPMHFEGSGSEEELSKAECAMEATFELGQAKATIVIDSQINLNPLS